MKKNLLNLNDLHNLNLLLQTDLNFTSCLKLITTKNNKKTIDRINSKLKSGYDVNQFLLKYIPKSISSYLKSLIEVNLFKDSINLALSFYEIEKVSKNQIIKKLMYPFFLLFLSIIGLIVFDRFALNAMITIIKNFEADLLMINIFRIFIKVLVIVILIFISISIFAFIYFSKANNIIIFYKLVSKYIPNNIYILYHTRQFINLYNCTSKLGYNTNSCLQILKSIKQKPIVSIMANEIENQLLASKQFDECFNLKIFDSNLSTTIKIATYANNFHSMLDNYVFLSGQNIENIIKKLMSIMQFSIYVFIGLLIIFIYQLLFIPMQAISNF